MFMTFQGLIFYSYSCFLSSGIGGEKDGFTFKGSNPTG